MANDWHDLVEEVIALQQDPETDTTPGPSIQWYPEKWLSDSKIMLMNLPAQGAHFRLLMLAWKGFTLEGDPVPGSIPADPELLRAICQRPENWDEIWLEVVRAWKEYRGRLWNLGLCKAYLSQIEHRKRRQRAGKKAAKARWASTKQEQEETSAGQPQTTAVSSACDSHSSRMPIAAGSHTDPSIQATSTDAIRPLETSPLSVSVPVSVSVNRKTRTGTDETDEDQPGLLVAAGDIQGLEIPKADRQKVAQLLADPVRIDPVKHRAHKLTDEKATRDERIHLVAHLARYTSPAIKERIERGETADSALDLWSHWRSQRKAKVKADCRPWFSEVQTLRKLLNGDHSPSEVVDALLAAGAAGWQGFEWAWIEGSKQIAARAGERPPTGAAGFLPEEEDGIEV